MLPVAFMPPEVSQASLDEAADLIVQIEAASDAGLTTCPALDRLRALTDNATLTVEQYHEVSGAMSYSDAALLAFYPEPAAIPDLDKSAFVWICETMQAHLVLGDFDYWFRLFCLNARASNAGDLVFHPPQSWIDRLIAAGEIPSHSTPMTFQPTAQQIAEEAWKDNTIQL